jgi:hypothetical protein
LHRISLLGFAVIMLGILFLQTIAPATAQIHELAYDNGVPTGSVSLPYTPTMWAGGEPEKQERNVWIGNQMLAVRFTTDNGSVEMLRLLRFYIAGDLHSFNVYAFDSDQNFFLYYRHFGPSEGSQYVSDIYTWTATPNSTGWVDLNVTSWNSIFVRGNFYIAVEFTVAEKPRLGVDTTGPESNRSFLVANMSSWIGYSSYAEQHQLPAGSLMIRAEVAPVYEGENGMTGPVANPRQLTSVWDVGIFITIEVLAVVTSVAFRLLLESLRRSRSGRT